MVAHRRRHRAGVHAADHRLCTRHGEHGLRQLVEWEEVTGMGEAEQAGSAWRFRTRRARKAKVARAQQSGSECYGLVTTVTSELPVRDQNRRTKRWLHRTGTTFLEYHFRTSMTPL